MADTPFLFVSVGLLVNLCKGNILNNFRLPPIFMFAESFNFSYFCPNSRNLV